MIIQIYLIHYIEYNYNVLPTAYQQRRQQWSVMSAYDPLIWQYSSINSSHKMELGAESAAWKQSGQEMELGADSAAWKQSGQVIRDK